MFEGVIGELKAAIERAHADGETGFPISNGPWPGMSLRDWFAGQVAAGMASSTAMYTPKEIAELAYEVADAMIKRSRVDV